MMIIKKIVLYILITYVFFFISCGCTLTTRNSVKEQEFRKMFTGIPLSGYLKLTELDDVGVKTIIITNISKDEIYIPVIPDQLFVFLEAQQEWVSLQEQMSYDEAFVLYPEEDIDKNQMKSWLKSIDPDLTQFNRPFILRAVIIGEIAKDGKATGNKVGSYIDLEYE